ncbi:uncharacterized protein LOC131314389 isoform X2 [Rhododendron vialii]|uniref:uncharacterized protein LOC131314389 isoform X2 n=1 Tax=Rhododendron vialii TaxID=182163 RepID=UPI00265E3286|nr:uncharacterized protein LOC131314389 isoform X2 [Rhododendron vialii]
MVDGTISMMEGLGCKAIDSNGMRRKQKNSSEAAPILGPQINSIPIRSSPSNPTHKPFDLCPGALPPLDSTTNPSPSSDFNLGSTLKNAVHAPSPAGFGAFGPKTFKNTSPSRKLKQVFEEALVGEAEERVTNLLDNNPQFERPQGKLSAATVVLLICMLLVVSAAFKPYSIAAVFKPGCYY